MNNMRKSIIMVLGAVATAAAFGAVTGTITTENGDSLKGVIRWSARDKAYAVAKGNTEIQVKPIDVAELNIDKPAGYDAAIEKISKGQGAAAAADLQKIVKEYQHLQWDKLAGRYLAEAYVAAGKPSDALSACQDIIKADPDAAFKGDLAPAYWSALLALDKKNALNSALEKAAKGEDAFSRGAALIMRGDIVLKEGKESNDAAKQALLDGYLRVVYLYNKDPEVAAKLQPEALYKAALCFEKLGQSGRADFMRTELKRTYASSPWAAR